MSGEDVVLDTAFPVDHDIIIVSILLLFLFSNKTKRMKDKFKISSNKSPREFIRKILARVVKLI